MGRPGRPRCGFATVAIDATQPDGLRLDVRVVLSLMAGDAADALGRGRLGRLLARGRRRRSPAGRGRLAVGAAHGLGGRGGELGAGVWARRLRVIADGRAEPYEPSRMTLDQQQQQ